MDIPSYLLGKKAGGGSGGTTNYADLSNKPQINSVELSENKSLSDLSIQGVIDSSNKLSSDLVDDTNATNLFVTSSEKSTWNSKSNFSGSYNDLTNKPSIPDVVQYSTMPTASADTIGKIVQYTGTTGNDYTNGYFYIGTTNGAATPTYSWSNINVQPASSGSSCNLITVDGSNLVLKPTWTGNQNVTNANDKTLWNNIASELLTRYNNGKKPILVLLTTGNTTGGITTISETKNVLFYVSNVTSTRIDLRGVGYVIGSSNYPYKPYLYMSRSNESSAWDIYYNKISNDNFLTINNTASYTPTQDYNPATKKYVDDKLTTYTGYDATKTQVLKNVSGTLTWVDE